MILDLAGGCSRAGTILRLGAGHGDGTRDCDSAAWHTNALTRLLDVRLALADSRNLRWDLRSFRGAIVRAVIGRGGGDGWGRRGSAGMRVVVGRGRGVVVTAVPGRIVILAPAVFACDKRVINTAVLR